MSQVRRVVMWTGEGALALLAVLSIVGALLGAERARALFNSLPLVVYWVALALLLAGGVVLYPRLHRRPGLLAIHLGSLLVVAGAMWGSDRAHALRRRVLGGTKVARGYIVIQEGASEHRILGPDGRTVVGELPFDLYLEDFRIAYYPPPERPWPLVAVVPIVGGDGRVVERRQVEVPWEVGRGVVVPGTRVVVTVLEYLPHARPVYAEGAEPVVEVRPPRPEGGAGEEDGPVLARLPARVGAEATLDSPPMTVRVRRVFRCLKVRRTAEGFEPYEAEGEGLNPAVELEVERPDGTRGRRYALALLAGHGDRPDEPRFRYVFPEPTGAEADPSSPVPAMRVHVRGPGGREMTRWLLPGEDEPWVGLDLSPVAGPAASSRAGRAEASQAASGAASGAEGSPAAAEPTPAPELYLVRPQSPPRDYFSDLVVMVSGREVARKTVEVNHPLHWGGYHFYQSDYDHEAGRYTVLQVVSDSGLWAVWLGMGLVVAGAFWWFWGRAVIGWLGGKRGPGG